MFQGKALSAIAVVINIAKHHPNPADSSSISRDVGISVSYIEQIICYLRRAKIVKGIRGPGGGYCLNMEPSEITIADVSAAVEAGEPYFTDATVRRALSRVNAQQHTLYKTVRVSELIA